MNKDPRQCSLLDVLQKQVVRQWFSKAVGPIVNRLRSLESPADVARDFGLEEADVKVLCDAIVRKKRKAPVGPFPPFVEGSDTSEAAASSMVDHAPSMKRRILAFIRESGTHGMTCDEGEVKFMGRHQGVSPRINELWSEGLIIDSGKRRKTRSGRDAAVMVAREFASQVAQEIAVTIMGVSEEKKKP